MKTIFLITFLSLSFILQAQKPIVFKEKKWADVVKLAKKEKKSIFVDVTSAGMSKPETTAALNTEVFADPEIAKLLTSNFVFTRMDMGSEEGKAFRPLLSGSMYPCLLMLYSNGDKLATSNAYSALKDKTAFIGTVNKAIAKANLKRSSTRKIIFRNISLDEAKVLSEKENKPIFIDAFFVGCHWCVEMEKDAFCLDDVADFYNNSFICLHIDFKKNPEMAKTYKPKGYPAYFYLDNKGDVLYTTEGYTSGENFIGYGKTALKKGSGI
jgi:thioredoxin-related protein